MYFFECTRKESSCVALCIVPCRAFRSSSPRSRSNCLYKRYFVKGWRGTPRQESYISTSQGARDVMAVNVHGGRETRRAVRGDLPLHTIHTSLDTSVGFYLATIALHAEVLREHADVRGSLPAFTVVRRILGGHHTLVSPRRVAFLFSSATTAVVLDL